MKTLKKNLITVLNRISNDVSISDDETVELWASAFDEMLDNLKDNDFFGTEGQNDPRGDNRNAKWTIKNIK
jgi:hypothetical protein